MMNRYSVARMTRTDRALACGAYSIELNIRHRFFSPPRGGGFGTRTASPDDGVNYGRQLYHDLDDGKYGDVAPVTDDDIKAHREIVNGAKKEKRLIEADRKISPMLGYALSGILSDAEKETFKEWNEYRKALEDIDVTATDIKWPAKPE